MMLETNIGEYERVFLNMLVYNPMLIDTLDAQSFLFFTDSSLAIFDALVKAREISGKPDLLMIADELNKAGNRAHVPELVSQKPPLSTANAAFYRDKLVEYARKRELKRTVDSMREAIEDTSVSADELADKALESISAAMQKTTLKTSPTIAATIQEYMDDVNRRVLEHRNHTATPICTGFFNVDEILGVMFPGEMVVIAARPSCGKSVFAQSCAMHVANTLNIPSAIFSLEMEREMIMDRMLASQEVSTVRELREGRLTDDSIRKMISVCDLVRETPLAIYDSVYSTAQLHSYIRREVVNRGVKFVAIDYLGLLAGLGGDFSRARWERVGEESRQLKLMAKELKVVIMILVQLNRDAEGVEPTLSMLRDSGSIEQDADKIVFLWSREDEDKNAQLRQVMVKVGKNRNGAIGQVPLMFDGPHVKMYVEVPEEKTAPETSAMQGSSWKELGD